MVSQQDIQKQIAFHIKNSGMTQTEIAKKLGIKQPTVSEYVYGRSFPSLETLANLCILLDVSADEILCIEEMQREKRKGMHKAQP